MINVKAPRESVRRFFRAIEKGDMEGVRNSITPDLINKVHMVKDKRLIPLHLASRNGHMEIVLFLIENGVDIDAPDERMTTAIIHASQWGRHEIAMLLASHGADISHQDWYGRSALSCYTDDMKQEQLRIAATAAKHRNYNDNVG